MRRSAVNLNKGLTLKPEGVAFMVSSMHRTESFSRLLPAASALHWTAVFGALAAGAQAWTANGQGAAVSRLAEPFLAGRLAQPEAAFALSVLFLVLAIAFLWAFLTALLTGPQARSEHRDVARLAHAAGIGGVSLAGVLAGFAGSPMALALSLAAIAALFASAVAVEIAPAGEVRAVSPARARAVRAASLARPVTSIHTLVPGKDA